MTFEKWDNDNWKVTCRDGDEKEYELKAPSTRYIFNEHDFLQLCRNINAVAEHIYDKEVYYIHDDNIFNRETGEQLLGVIEDCMKLNEQDKKIKDLEAKMNEQAFELYAHHIVSFEKAVELSAMNYHDFVEYAYEKGYGAELSL